MERSVSMLPPSWRVRFEREILIDKVEETRIGIFSWAIAVVLYELFVITRLRR